MTPFSQKTRAGIIRPKAGGRPRGARMQGRGNAQRLVAATVPLWEDTWYRDTVEELLDMDPGAPERAQRLARQQGEWKFTPAPVRWTFIKGCADPYTGETMPFHDPVTPPGPQDDPGLYRDERAGLLDQAARKAPVAFCRRCRMWINQDNGDTF